MRLGGAGRGPSEAQIIYLKKRNAQLLGRSREGARESERKSDKRSRRGAQGRLTGVAGRQGEDGRGRWHEQPGDTRVAGVQGVKRDGREVPQLGRGESERVAGDEGEPAAAVK